MNEKANGTIRKFNTYKIGQRLNSDDSHSVLKDRVTIFNQSSRD